MNPAPRLLPQHRLARLQVWILTALIWLGGVLFAGKQPTSRHTRKREYLLEFCAHLVGNLIVIRGAELSGQMRRSAPPTARFGVDLSRSGRRRAAIGSRLRRALYHPHIARRLANLATAVRDLDLWSARFARRLRAGLTRRRPIHVAREHVFEPCALGAAACAAPADTS